MVSKSKDFTHFSIELDIKGFIVTGTLTMSILLVVFYLGVITGKATRDPQEASLISKNTTLNNENNLNSTNGLTAFVTSDSSGRQISEWNKRLKEITETTDKLKARVKEKSSPQLNPAEKIKGEYTIQVLVTSNESKAQKIVKSLKQRNFDAYLTSIVQSASKKKLFRIRVGKFGKEDAKKVKPKLQKAIGGLGIQEKIKIILLES